MSQNPLIEEKLEKWAKTFGWLFEDPDQVRSIQVWLRATFQEITTAAEKEERERILAALPEDAIEVHKYQKDYVRGFNFCKELVTRLLANSLERV